MFAIGDYSEKLLVKDISAAKTGPCVNGQNTGERPERHFRDFESALSITVSPEG